MTKARVSPRTVAIGYALVAVAWMVILEVIAVRFDAAQTGWALEFVLEVAFVCATAWMVYLAAKRLEADLQEEQAKREAELRSSSEELASRSAALAASEERYRSLFELSSAVMVVLDPETGAMLDANRAAAEFYGWDQAKLRTMRIFDLNVMPPSEISALMKGAVARGRGSFHFRHRTASGEVRDVEAHSGPIVLNGRTLLFSVIHDITERCILERELVAQREALRASVEVNRVTFDNAPVGIAHVAIDGTWLRVNRRLCAILGRTETELLSGSLHGIADPEDDATDQAFTLRMLRGEIETYAMEKRFFRADRSIVMTAVTVSLVRDASGEPAYFISVVEDITARKRVEEDLKASEARLNFALKRCQTAGWTLNLEDGTTTRTDEHHRIFGYRADLTEWGYEEFRGYILEEDRARIDEVFLGALQRNEGFDFECRIRRTDGAIRWIWVTGDRLPEVPGQAPHMSGIVQDITDRRRAEQQLRDSEARLKLALQAARQGTFDLDMKTGDAVVSPEYTEMLGYPHEGFKETNARWIERLHPEDRERTAAAYLDYVAGRQPEYRVEFRQRTASGEWKWILSAGRIVERASDGTPLRLLGTHTDISELKQLQHRLLRSQRMESVGMLAGGIAHDLNNVLAPIILSVELLRMRTRDPADRRTLDVIDASARRGAGVVRQVLTFARGVDGERVPVRASDVVREVCLIAAETFPRNISIGKDCTSEDSRVLGDATQLHQVLLNLAVNARDAMPDGGSLSFAVELATLTKKVDLFTGELPPGRYVVIAVRDTGPGIPREDQERVFEPFFTTKPQGKGTGLGLPTALGIVRSHGGLMDVVSHPLGGTAFVVYLPSFSEDPKPEKAPLATCDLRGEGRTLLLCDDEESIREVAALVLERTGFRVLKASDGTEAVELFARHANEVSIVVMDLMMPAMNGDQAAVHMLRRRPDVPLLFMSGLVERDALQATMAAAGATRYALVRKPFEVSELVRQICVLLGGDPKLPKD